jgi:hypothetical protein
MPKDFHNINDDDRIILISKWFEKLYNKAEEVPIKDVKSNEFSCIVNQTRKSRYNIGIFSTPMLSNLRTMTRSINELSTFKIISNTDIMGLIYENPNATFQVASQFNCLEMINENETPSLGVTKYYTDNTQGPLCSIACGAGTVHRNYTHNNAACSEDEQIHNAEYLQKALNNLFEIRNGYTINNKLMSTDLQSIIEKMDHTYLMGLLKVDFHQNVGVTYTRDKGMIQQKKIRYVADYEKTVNQIFCSAMSFQNIPYDIKNSWDVLAAIILNATYEATILLAYQNYVSNPSTKNYNKVFLTLVGGGVFNNKKELIVFAIKRAIKMAENYGLEIILVDYSNEWKNYFNDLLNPNDNLIEIDPSKNLTFQTLYFKKAKKGNFIFLGNEEENLKVDIKFCTASGWGFLAQAIYWYNTNAINLLFDKYNCPFNLPFKNQATKQVILVDPSIEELYKMAIFNILKDSNLYKKTKTDIYNLAKEIFNICSKKFMERDTSFTINKYLKYKDKYHNLTMKSNKNN